MKRYVKWAMMACLSLVLALSACQMEKSQEILEQPSAFSGEGSSGPGGPRSIVNPYDSIGWYHNALVVYVLEHLDESNGDVYLQSEALTIEYFESIGIDLDSSKVTPIFRSIQNDSYAMSPANWKNIQLSRVNALDLSPNATQFISKLIAAIDTFDYTNSDHRTSIDVSQLEAEVLSSSLEDDEITLILMGASFVRWSSYLWYQVYHGGDLSEFGVDYRGTVDLKSFNWCWKCTLSDDLTYGLEGGVGAVVGAAVTGVAAPWIPLAGGAGFVIFGGYASLHDVMDQMGY